MMNRRQAVKVTFHTAAAAGILSAQPLAPSEFWDNPAIGTGTSSGTKSTPLRTLAEAARRVN
jgi:hypothetical protein